MRLFRHPRWHHLDYRVKVATTQENKPPTQGTRQWTTPRWRCGSILLPSLNAGVLEPTGGQKSEGPINLTNHWRKRLWKRTSRQLSAIRRIAKYLNKDCIMKLFNAFILSNFNYSSIVWHFCPHESTSKVEKIHKSALRIVLNDYKSNYDTLLQLSNLQPLLISRFRAILYEVYKCIREINPSLTSFFRK